MAFVSTNSITQGELVGILWGDLLFPLGIKILFAHRTFKWSNEATGKAAVYCVIIGFGTFSISKPHLFIYRDIRGEPAEFIVENINPYLVAAPDIVVRNRSKTLCGVQEMKRGSMPTDGGFFLLTSDERDALLQKEPGAESFLRHYISGEEFLHNTKRYCLWLVDAKPEELHALPEVMKRIELVKQFRALSKAGTTRDYPYHTLFRQVTQPKDDYILVPRHSSENREYVPMGFFSKENIVADSCMAIGGATTYDFGILESEMHMSWMRAVAGRLKSDYRYSKDIVYNNFPWPSNSTDEQRKTVEDAAQTVLNVRSKYPSATLADLYDPNTMPVDLLKAHKALDRAVDACYGTKKFKDEPERLEFLFEQYKELIEGK